MSAIAPCKSVGYIDIPNYDTLDANSRGSITGAFLTFDALESYKDYLKVSEAALAVPEV